MLVGYSPTSIQAKALTEGFRELGYVQGKDIVLDWRYARGRYERLASLADELVRRGVDVIVTESIVATRAAMNATRTTPIVMALVADPVGSRLVTSLGRPGGNVTGLTNMTPDLVAKRLELLKEAVPFASRIAVLWNPDTPFHRMMIKQIRTVAPLLRVRPEFIPVHRSTEFEGAFSGMSARHIDALLAPIRK